MVVCPKARHFDNDFGIITFLWDIIFGTAYFRQPEGWPAVGRGDINELRSFREWFDLPRDIITEGPKTAIECWSDSPREKIATGYYNYPSKV